MRALVVVGATPRAGKTRVAVAVVRALRGRGVLAAAMKPVETGCPHGEDHDLRALDGDALHEVAPWVPRLVIAPYRFAGAGAPAAAAAAVGLELRIADLVDAVRAAGRYADLRIVEAWGTYPDRIAADGDALALARALDAELVVVSATAAAAQVVLDAAAGLAVGLVVTPEVWSWPCAHAAPGEALPEALLARWTR